MTLRPLRTVSPRTALVVAACALIAAAAAAQPMPPSPPAPPGAPMPPGRDPIGDRLFPPELIMGHQAELQLDGKSSKAIIDEIQRFQAQAVKIQWDMNAAGAALSKALSSPRVDENAALADADRVMALEHDLKKAHLTLLIRLKNLLTPAQQEKLRALRR